MKTVRVMWLGHSMVRGLGSPGSGGPRGYVSPTLYDHDWPCQVQFVGSQHDADPALAALLGGHEGRDGWTLAGALAALPGIMAANPPDVVLLMLGTVEIVTGPQSRADAPGQLAALLDAFPPAAWVVVGTIPTVQPPGFLDPAGPSYVASFNDSLRTLVKQRRAISRNVVLCESGQAIGGNLFDGIHPSDIGYTAMGGAFRAHLEDLLWVLAATP